MANQTISGVRWTLDVSTERILISPETGEEPDPAWRFTDSHGHPHRYAARGPERVLVVPTVHWEVTETWWCPDCHDEHEDGHYVCDECGDEVSPGTRWNSLPLYVSGPRTAVLTGWRSDGVHLEAMLIAEQVKSLSEALRAGNGDEAAIAMLDSMPPEQTRSITFASR